MSKRADARPPRVLVPDLASFRGSFEEILLRKEEREHVRARRLRDGDEVVALDGKGARARARLVRGGTTIALIRFEEISSSSSSLSSSSPRPLPGEPLNRVTIALACAELSRIEWAVEKGSECGAAGFVLLDAEHSQRSHVAALSRRIPRLIRIAEEAVKQCDRTIVPFVEGPKSTREFLKTLRGERLIVADPQGVPIASVASGAPTTLAIGPEGGFTPGEISLFEERGALRTSLGVRILRLETAVVVALARLVDPA
jgi:16S rRNA (uracil1498-N3)-methyltransferase